MPKYSNEREGESMEIKQVLPQEIEKNSFQIIEEELGETVLDPVLAPIIKRVIHTSADFEYVHNLCFSENVVQKAIAAIKQGACIVTDTQMARAGINKPTLAQFGGEAYCFIGDEDVREAATQAGTTRAAMAMEKAARLGKPIIFAIGNAPTALIQLNELVKQKKIQPELIIGVPVGFVNVVESKELVLQMDVPYIVARGRKGGSNVAAAICNALLYLASERKL